MNRWKWSGDKTFYFRVSLGFEREKEKNKLNLEFSLVLNGERKEGFFFLSFLTCGCLLGKKGRG